MKNARKVLILLTLSFSILTISSLSSQVFANEVTTNSSAVTQGEIISTVNYNMLRNSSVKLFNANSNVQIQSGGNLITISSSGVVSSKNTLGTAVVHHINPNGDYVKYIININAS
ncbi:hypothetical protein [Paenibacillus pini]|uniref:BIG2 domain-containing protein n=1 Tax=Paenibacillus pini JCM 16418 TaxID=1236976 RepID=W7YJ19_9BACL|nr:hypothetical protein [Paenibacillus pini]GAF07568.1 hypothetical protein JCM16418_1592 [Paenibacillus pini JCM 16418]